MAIATPHPFHVTVVGAGTTGLLLAQGLKSAGVSCTVFERETSETYRTRPREWGMTLHWAAELVWKKLPKDFNDRLRSIRCNPFHDNTPGEDDFLPVCNGITGEVMLKMHGDSPIRVSRSKMRALFSEGLDIQHGKKIVQVTYSGSTVTATFEDGTGTTGNILVGCDGAKSKVRELVVGSEAAQMTVMPINTFNFNQKFTAEQALHLQTVHPLFKMSYYPETAEMFWLSIQDVPDPDKPETWLFQLMMSWGGSPTLEEMPTNEDRMRVFKERAQRWAEPWKTAGLNVTDDTEIYAAPATYWMPTAWHNHNGMITLAGDAAHPMPPHRGQGLNNAMQDASNLVDALTDHAARAYLGEAIDAYEAEMRERASKEVQISKEQATKSSDWKTFMDTPMVRIGMKRLADAVAAA
ncbi:MAG: hypothetical protein FRX48_07029 [Lasallia pustulata]|uniref:FAD-binding domain-containing protein n=1 Tax=Lasallia pustulata TaxID=136370 RepID=A0A5M8PKM6_9LECA|nr:MAG: hypothetical protein FRX48_07029 [Lasallia pustulata]